MFAGRGFGRGDGRRVFPSRYRRAPILRLTWAIAISVWGSVRHGVTLFG